MTDAVCESGKRDHGLRALREKRRTLVRLAVALNCKLTALVSDFDKADLREMIEK